MGLDNPIHIAFLLILLLLVFGAKRLPEMGKSLGTGMRGFKDALSGEEGLSPFATHEHAAAPQPVAVPQQVAVTQAAPVVAQPVQAPAVVQPVQAPAVVQPVQAPVQAAPHIQQETVPAAPEARIVPESVREQIPA
jgi:sec-independent protein translocase protein TatA